MSDEQDVSPTRVGEAREPKWFVTLAIMPDGNFACDGNCLDNETVVRALLHKGSFEIDRYLGKKAFEKTMAAAQETRVLDRMYGDGKKTIDKKLRGMR